MKRKLVTLDSHAYPPFYAEISEKTSDVQIKYNNNPFYIFCKNFELVTAQVYKFSKLKNDKQKGDQNDKQNNKQSLEDFCTLVALNLLNSYNNDSAEEDFDTIVNFLKKEFNFPDSLITNSKEEIEKEKKFLKYYYDDVLEGAFRDHLEIALAKKIAKALAKPLTALNYVSFSKLLLKFSALFGKCSDNTINTVGVFVIGTISVLDTSNYCDVFTLYEYLLNNRCIFEEVEDEIKEICNEFIGRTISYKYEDIPALAQENLLCIDSITVGLKDEDTGEISNKLEEKISLVDKADRAPELSVASLLALGKSKYNDDDRTEHNERRIDGRLKEDVTKDFFTYLKTSLFINYENWGISFYSMLNREQLRQRLTYEMTVDSLLGDNTKSSALAQNSTSQVGISALAKIYTLLEYERLVVKFLLDTPVDPTSQEDIVTSLDQAAEEYLKKQQEMDYKDYRKNVYDGKAYLDVGDWKEEEEEEEEE